MRKKLKTIFTLGIMLILIFSSYCFASSFYEYEENTKTYNEITTNQRLDSYEKFIFSILSEDIFSATERIYGKVKLYDNKKIQYIKPYSNTWNDAGYEVGIEIETFTGAHNPPYFKDNLLFRINISNGTKIELIDYMHKEIVLD